MAELMVQGKELELDSEGFLVDPHAWDHEVAKALAATDGLELTERHFVVIDFMRAEWENTGQPPTLRGITKRSGVPTKELYQLFPKGPAKKAARAAGLGKPQGCI